MNNKKKLCLNLKDISCYTNGQMIWRATDSSSISIDGSHCSTSLFILNILVLLVGLYFFGYYLTVFLELYGSYVLEMFVSHYGQSPFDNFLFLNILSLLFFHSYQHSDIIQMYLICAILYSGQNW
jgi:hypothetical protein